MDSIFPGLGEKLGKAALRSSDSFSNFTDRLQKAGVGDALKDLILNLHFARTIISALVVAFGVTCSVLFVRYNNRSDFKKQTQLGYVTQLWFGENKSGLIWTLISVWLSSVLLILGAPLLLKVGGLFGKVR